MKSLKFIFGAALFLALVMVVQLAEPPLDSPAMLYQRLPDVRSSAVPEAVAGNSFDKLAGGTVADAVLYGELSAQGALTFPTDFDAALNASRPMAAVFPPADAAITLAKIAHHAEAINPTLAKQLRQTLTAIQTAPQSANAVEKFKDNFMPMFELAKRCRTMAEFQTILRQADSADQLKVLTKIASATPTAAQHLSAVLTGADRATASACLDLIMREGPKGLDALYAALGKGAAGLKFVATHPGFSPSAGAPRLTGWREQYQVLRYQYGSSIEVLKYLAIAVLCALLVLVVVPGRYLEKLIARPGGPVAAPGAFHYFMSALLVGAVLAVLAYLLSLAAKPAIELPTTTSTTTTSATGETVTVEHGEDNAFLSGTVVLLSLAIHAVVWFFVRGKIRQVEDDDISTTEFLLKRLENLDIFLDLPLFTGLALTVVAFILITLNAGMSRHFAYTSTVVGIMSAVSLRIRYVYPLKERLIQPR